MPAPTQAAPISAQAPHPVKARHHRGPGAPFDRAGLRVHRDVQRALEHPPQRQRREQRRPGPGQPHRRPGRRVAGDGDRDQPVAPPARQRRQRGQHRAQRSAEQRRAQRGVVQAESGFDLRNVGGPRREQQAVSDEHRGDTAFGPTQHVDGERSLRGRRRIRHRLRKMAAWHDAPAPSAPRLPTPVSAPSMRWSWCAPPSRRCIRPAGRSWAGLLAAGACAGFFRHPARRDRRARRRRDLRDRRRHPARRIEHG